MHARTSALCSGMGGPTPCSSICLLPPPPSAVAAAGEQWQQSRGGEPHVAAAALEWRGGLPPFATAVPHLGGWWGDLTQQQLECKLRRGADSPGSAPQHGGNCVAKSVVMTIFQGAWRRPSSFTKQGSGAAAWISFSEELRCSQFSVGP